MKRRNKQMNSSHFTFVTFLLAKIFGIKIAYIINIFGEFENKN